jgi:hypothetical protein
VAAAAAGGERALVALCAPLALVPPLPAIGVVAAILLASAAVESNVTAAGR